MDTGKISYSSSIRPDRGRPLRLVSSFARICGSFLVMDSRIATDCRVNERHRASAGFTLIEILVVVVVIAILATLVAPNVFQHVGTARETTARSQVEMLGAALDAYRLHTGRYPSTQEGLAALWTRPATAPATWRGPYLRKSLPLDPWGNAYEYASPGEVNRDGYDLRALGADGRRGGEGEDADVTSW